MCTVVCDLFIRPKPWMFGAELNIRHQLCTAQAKINQLQLIFNNTFTNSSAALV